MLLEFDILLDGILSYITIAGTESTDSFHQNRTSLLIIIVIVIDFVAISNALSQRVRKLLRLMLCIQDSEPAGLRALGIHIRNRSAGNGHIANPHVLQLIENLSRLSGCGDAQFVF